MKQRKARHSCRNVHYSAGCRACVEEAKAQRVKELQDPRKVFAWDEANEPGY